jgi:hypothetical protein
MSDQAPTNGTPAPEATAPPGAPAAPSGDVFADLPADQGIFDRGYVERIRKEGQKYRDEARTHAEALGQYNTVFGGYDAEDRAVWFNLAQTWAQDPQRAAQIMDQIARTVLAPEPAQPGTTPPAAPEGDTGELTADRVQQMIAEAMATTQQTWAQQQAAAAEAQAVNEVYAEVRSSGYDPDSMEGFMVLWIANNSTGGDIAKAAEEMRNYRQRIVDEYVSGRKSGVTPVGGAGTSFASAPPEIKTLEDARKAADAFLRAQANA